MLPRRRSPRSLPLIAGLLAAVTQIAPPAIANTVQVYGVSGQTRQAIAEGTTFAVATREGGSCTFNDPIGVEAFLPYDAMQGDEALVITWHFNQSCEAVVSQIEVVPATGASSTTALGLGPQHQEWVGNRYADASSFEGFHPGDIGHIGDVQFTIQEQFGVTSTQTKNTMTWVSTVDGSRLYQGIQEPDFPNTECYASTFPEWTIADCLYTFTHPYDFRYDLISEARFAHLTGIRYTMNSLFQPSAPGGAGAGCGLSDGSLPPFWDQRCYLHLDGQEY